jgi:Flp pilus assembly protein CpaB
MSLRGRGSVAGAGSGKGGAVAASGVRTAWEWFRGPGRRRAWRRHVLRRAVAALCAGAAVLGLVAVARSPQRQQLVAVVVAARPLAVGEVATPSAVRTVLFPADLVPDDAAHQPAQVVGRPVTAALSAGEAVTTRRVRPDSVLTGQPIDLVAFHVTIPDVRAVSMVRPGDRVDLVGPSGVVAHSAPVLSVDSVVTTDFGSVLQGPGSSSGYDLKDAGVVVAVDQPTILNLAKTQQDALGRPQLALVLRPR